MEDPWISTAYIGDEFYEVEVFPDGHSDTYISPVFPNTSVDFNHSLFKEPVCRPSGVYSMLVVFLDFGNLAAGKEEILTDLTRRPPQPSTAIMPHTLPPGPGPRRSSRSNPPAW